MQSNVAKMTVTPAKKAQNITLHKQNNIRVAAYCRVSTGEEGQLTSYRTQKAFYLDLITKKPGWMFAGIYADEGISGTCRFKRDEFNRMMEDAVAGKIDYIVTKSISRFARNTIDTLDCVRRLKNLTPPVGVYFEKENGEASMIATLFDNAYERAVRLAKNNSISMQRLNAVNDQIEEVETRLQDAISHQVAALREAALEQSAELNEALSNGDVTIDEIDTDIRSGLTPGSIGTSFYGIETEEGSEAQIYTELVNDLQERVKTLQQERQTIEAEQGVLAIMKKNFEYFIACLKELPDANAAGMPLKVNGLDVQGSLMRDAEGKPIEGKTAAVHNGKIKLTPERIAEAPDMLHFEKGIYCAFIESGVLQGDVATYKTNFGVTLTSKGNRRTLSSFLGYKRSDLNGTVVYVDAPYRVYPNGIMYRRYLTTAAKKEREEAV